MQNWRVLVAAVCLGMLAISPLAVQAQQDPGPRSGPASAGGYYPTLGAAEQSLFTQAAQRFMEVDSILGSLTGEPGSGLGPTFNGNSCAQCHAQPTLGGSSPGLTSPQNPLPNPQVALATLDGATNTVPSFVSATGPVREARFVQSEIQRGVPDGGVHDLYTVTGRTDAQGCTLGQPDFAQQLANRNVIFRIPTPTFGLGLVEATPDSSLQANLAANQSAKARLGIEGSLNTSGNDGTVTRFGWKAQNKSLLVFAGEAYNVEQGVANEVFPNERSAVPGCVFNGSPEDATNIMNAAGGPTGTASEMSSDVVNFAIFMRLSAPATPGTQTASTQNGAALFNTIGCALCHSPSLTTGTSRYSGMSNVTYNPYSDFALHHMGRFLADGISQGAAGPDEFRTAPLWGVGQRLFFLHDGRTSDLLQAIKAHADCGSGGQPSGHDDRNRADGNSRGCRSEANGVINSFTGLSASQQQDILNFLRSL
jgi:mono/diheme cytochrome c family protein